MRKWILLLAAACIAQAAGGAAAQAKAKPQPKAACTASAVPGQKGQVSFSGGCKVNGRVIPVVAHRSYTVVDQSKKYVCNSVSGVVSGKTFAVLPADGYQATGRIWYTPKNKAIKVESNKTATFNLVLGGADMCGKPPIPALSPSAVCDWGMLVGQPDPQYSYCGVVYWKVAKPPVPVVTWATRATVAAGNVVSIGHLVSPSGICRATPYGGAQPTASWFTVLQFSYWQCGQIKARISIIDAWLFNSEGKVCHLPGYPEGTNKIQLPSDWDDVLQIAYTVDTFTGPQNVWNWQAYENSTAYLQLSGGTVDGCAALGLPVS